jgi:hypothetical protein
MRSNLIGTAAIVRAAYERRDLSGMLAELQRRVAANPLAAPAVLDLATLLEVCGQPERAAELQATALKGQRLYETVNGSGVGPIVLLIKVAGDLMANTPVEFLIEGTNTRLLTLYVDAHMEALPSLPKHDVAIMAVGESEANLPVLEILQRLQPLWPRPVLNNMPRRVMMLAREQLPMAFAGSQHVVVPEAFTIEAASLRALGIGQCKPHEILPNANFPFIVRPFGAHAGHGTRIISRTEQLTDYLRQVNGTRFTLSPFIDYAGLDGYFRKQRIVFINGQPFASHMAVSRHWMVHYLNAEMEIHADRRAQEASWMENFDHGFAVRHARAFSEIVERIGLDYFGIDCGELPDGRLILFEADIAMIVHAMDPPELFPYKKPAMRKLFNAFEAALQRAESFTPAAHHK